MRSMLRRLLTTAATATTAASLLLVAPAGAASASGSSLTLGHTHLYGWLGGNVVVSVGADGSERVSSRLPHGGFPQLSPNGAWLTWFTNKGLFVMHPDGSGYRRLRAGLVHPPLAWSPDSRSLLTPGGSSAVSVDVVHVADGSARPLVDEAQQKGVDPTSYAFARNGRWVLESTNRGWRLLSAQTGNSRAFGKAPCRFADHLSFSPDGRRVAFSCSLAVAPWSGVFDIATGKVTRLGDWHDASPVWLSATTLALTHEADSAMPTEIRQYDVRGRVLAAVPVAQRLQQLYAAAH